ncbi:MAG: DegT/DnrJ/EryC1/StrS family aminotransferase [Candidatus Aureabacteria bacterium]|nr:DegT/DnrJ/EryC1/StrS family aminotransferase [Candidatus Auribacterota bacterium]
MQKQIPFFRAFLTGDELKNVKRVLDSHWLTTGIETKAFEKEFCRFTGAKYAVGLNSCTAALHLSLIALGIKKDDVVITTPFTFASTANVIEHMNASLRFVDVNEDDFTIDLDKAEKVLSSKVKAVIPVHYAGSVCDLERLEKMCKSKKVKIIQDSAHCIEGKWNGKHVSNYGDTTCYSFYATKNITTGEGGMVTSKNSSLMEKIRILSLHGLSKNAWSRYSKKGNAFYQIIYPGFKYNMFDVQAAIGRAQLKKISVMRKMRKKVDALYRKTLSDIDGIRFQKTIKQVTHAHHLFVVDLNTRKSKIKRTKLMEILSMNNIAYSVHFTSLHLHPYYKNKYKFKPNDFPVANRLSREIISLPFFAEMQEEDVVRVAKCFKKAR